MSVTVYSLVVDFTSETSNECPEFLLEVPQEEVKTGESVEIRLWGSPDDLDSSWVLYHTSECLGPGSLHTANASGEGSLFTQQIDFEDNRVDQLSYPAGTILSVEALTPLITLDDSDIPREVFSVGSTWVDNVKSTWERVGYTCLRLIENIKLYGSIWVRGRTVPNYLRWMWEVPANAGGDHWFMVCRNGQLKTKFKIELPELASQVVDYKNITLQAIDCVTEIGIAGAKVYLDELYKGETDDDGYINIDNVETGVHGVRITAENYTATDSDTLVNEEIIVQ